MCKRSARWMGIQGRCFLMLWGVGCSLLSGCNTPGIGAIDPTVGEPPRDESLYVYSALAHRPKDGSSTNWVGDGYDTLSGQRRASCLDNTKTVIRTYPLNRAVDTLYMVGSRSELAEKLNLEVSAEASGTYKTVTGNGSVKTAIVRETSISSNSVTAIAEYRYLKDEIMVYDSLPSMAEAKIALLQQDKVNFRRECGDKFTRKIRTGASLYLIFKADKVVQSSNNQNQVESALKLGFGSLLGANGSTKLSEEQKKIVSNYTISCKCYSEGTSAHPCADNMLNATGVDVDDKDNTILERIKSAKMALANDIDNGRNIVTVSEELEKYDVPAVFGSKGLFEVFFDYRGYLEKIQEWLKIEDQVTPLCDATKFLVAECTAAQAQISGAIENCAEMRNVLAGSCQSPVAGQFDALLSANSAGEVVLCEDGGCNGRKLALRFDHLYSGYAEVYPNTLYSLHDDRFRFADIVSCYWAGSLKPGWQLVLYEHPDGGGRQAVISAGTVYGNTPKKFNDKASAFRLERISN